jgi:hypothetical protein
MQSVRRYFEHHARSTTFHKVPNISDEVLLLMLVSGAAFAALAKKKL